MEAQWNSVVDRLATALSNVGATESHATMADPKLTATVDPKQATAIVSKLIIEALSNGLTFSGETPTFKPLSGGNTALAVSITSAHVDFVFKMDTNAKLVREARTIDDLRKDIRLGSFSRRLPRIYAIHAESSPYAYLMEWFDPKVYLSVKQIFFDPEGGPTPDHAKDIAVFAIDALSEAYRNSKDDRSQVRMMGEAYYRRMEDSLYSASKISQDFASVPLIINGIQTLGWRELLNHILASKERFQALAPPFITVVHGDPNPGNILIRRSGPDIRNMKFIDLKDWKSGDYLFDIAKLTHFLLYTGPLEELTPLTNLKIKKVQDTLHFFYERSVPDYVEAAVEACRSRTQQLAEELGDTTWELRYQLAITSNILGLVAGRLTSGYADQAKILYAEGILLLQNFVTRWKQEGKPI